MQVQKNAAITTWFEESDGVCTAKISIKFAMRELQQFELDRMYVAYYDIERMMHTDFSFYLIDHPL